MFSPSFLRFIFIFNCQKDRFFPPFQRSFYGYVDFGNVFRTVFVQNDYHGPRSHIARLYIGAVRYYSYIVRIFRVARDIDIFGIYASACKIQMQIENRMSFEKVFVKARKDRVCFIAFGNIVGKRHFFRGIDKLGIGYCVCRNTPRGITESVSRFAPAYAIGRMLGIVI